VQLQTAAGLLDTAAAVSLLNTFEQIREGNAAYKALVQKALAGAQ